MRCCCRSAQAFSRRWGYSMSALDAAMRIQNRRRVYRKVTSRPAQGICSSNHRTFDLRPVNWRVGCLVIAFRYSSLLIQSDDPVNHQLGPILIHNDVPLLSGRRSYGQKSVIGGRGQAHASLTIRLPLRTRKGIGEFPARRCALK